jgi:hypothetical protein
MANTTLFRSLAGALIPGADTRNEAGGRLASVGGGGTCVSAPLAQLNTTEREDILNVGGFSDQVFDVIADFAAGRLHSDHWVGLIESVVL